MDAAPFDLTSIAPLLILSASCECVGDAPLSATPPSISMSDILRGLGRFCCCWCCCAGVHVEADLFSGCQEFGLRTSGLVFGGIASFIGLRRTHSAIVGAEEPHTPTRSPCRLQYVFEALHSCPSRLALPRRAHRDCCIHEQPSFRRQPHAMPRRPRERAWWQPRRRVSSR
jgi:hypothetical protein